MRMKYKQNSQYYRPFSSQPVPCFCVQKPNPKIFLGNMHFVDPYIQTYFNFLHKRNSKEREIVYLQVILTTSAVWN